jgi:DNA-binding HxlR family transcriptional regulator
LHNDSDYLNALVKGGLLRRQRYSDKPPRYEYVLTDRGRDFRPVLVSLLAWGNRHFSPEGASVLLVNSFAVSVRRVFAEFAKS